ncbi:amino acid permease, partial [archaeon]
MPYDERSIKEATALVAEAVESPKDLPTPIASVYNIYWLGITIVIGGQIIFWNLALKNGFFEFVFSVVIVGSGYVCLTFSLAEMTSILPFAGGSYGYVRCALGPFIGFVVGCCEAME